MSENQGVILTISIVVLVCIIALIGVGYSFMKTMESLKFNGSMDALMPDRDVTLLETKSNFNFAIPKVEAKKVEEPKPQPKPQPKAQPVEEKKQPENKTQEQKTYNFNFAIPEAKTFPKVKSIQIPSIRYNSPVIYSTNGDSAIDYGAWYYPSNHPLEGEAVFLCHRRFFKSYDPKSCWNLDKVKTNDTLYINFSDGSQAFYKVDVVTVAKGTDINIYTAGSDQKIKLISCAKENGKIGSASYRIVVIASLVSYNK